MPTRIYVLMMLVAGCGAPRQDAPLVPRSPSAADHLAEASTHDHQAATIDGTPRPPLPDAVRGPHLDCIDQPLAGVPETGGKRMNVLRPCWTSVLSPDAQDERDADAHRRVAAKHRAAASSLLRAEKEHCSGLGEAEISESPFWHKKDVISARPVRKQGRIVGATIRFRQVPGLSSEWLDRAARCHQARAAVLGYPPMFMTYCPLALADTAIEFAPTADRGVDVTITSRRDEIGAAIWGRAADLMLPTRQQSSEEHRAE